MRQFEMAGVAKAAPEGWSDERVAALTKLWADGLSASQIAQRLGCVSRNAVIGKVHRLELPARRPRERQVKGRHKARPAGNVFVFRRPTDRPPLPPTAPIRAIPIEAPAPLGLDVIAIGARQCRWPIGDPREAGFGFCGHPAHRTYCPAHHAAAYR